MIKSLYIHIPFCDNICSYCDFIKVYAPLFDRKKYLDLLIDEIKENNILDNSLDTIYIGGGTPSCLKEDEIEYLLSYLYEHFNNVKEFTFEANPESLTLSKIKLLKKYNVNRISLGVETTSTDGLILLNRKHTKEIVRNVISLLKENNISNINLDFIFGYPNQSISSLKKDLEFAIKEDVPHLSFYSLIIENNTLLKIKKFQPLDDEILAKMYDLINRTLNNNDINHYEVSNYCKKGYESIHNLTYWNDLNYYAVGVSASSYIDDKRIKNTSSLTSYLKGINHKEIENIDLKSEKEEFIFLSFRLIKGLSIKEYKRRFNEEFLNKYKVEIEKHKNELNINNDYISIKEKYFFIMDSIVIDFID